MKRLLLSTLLLSFFLGLPAQTGRFSLMKLPYATNALEPAISRHTMELHHGKHLATYVANLNELIADDLIVLVECHSGDIALRHFHIANALEEIMTKASGPIFNNAGQMLNHNLYFTQFSPHGGGSPKGALGKAIERQWGSFENFKTEFIKRGTALFGSGWVWLAQAEDGTLLILQEAGGSNPIAKGQTPLLGFDVWEHAYYLDYQNRRAEHLSALWGVVHWPTVEKRYEVRP